MTRWSEKANLRGAIELGPSGDGRTCPGAREGQHRCVWMWAAERLPYPNSEEGASSPAMRATVQPRGCRGRGVVSTEVTSPRAAGRAVGTFPPHTVCSISWAPCCNANADSAGLGGSETAFLMSPGGCGCCLLVGLVHCAVWSKDINNRNPGHGCWAHCPFHLSPPLSQRDFCPIPFTRCQLGLGVHLKPHHQEASGARWKVSRDPLSTGGLLKFCDPRPFLRSCRGRAWAWGDEGSLLSRRSEAQGLSVPTSPPFVCR